MYPTKQCISNTKGNVSMQELIDYVIDKYELK